MSCCNNKGSSLLGGCGSSTCGCAKTTAVPAPFYEQACEIQESHEKQVIYESYATSVKTASTFNMPACDTNATILFPGLKNIQSGSYLWNATYGYLKVISFDPILSQVVVLNECQVGNAAPGTSIPACTLFTVTDPPHDAASGQLGVFVAVDFVAPANGNCLDIAVTGVAGLTIGTNVQIGSGIYRLSAIIDSTTVTICNDGSGIVPGTIVHAKDSSGLYITPVTPLSSNACENTANETGALLTCHNNVQAPLNGSFAGQIPVLIDAATNEVQFQSLDLPTSICTTMTSCLNLLAGTTDYTIVVADSSIFIVGDIIIIHDPLSETYRWEVLGKPDGTHVQIRKTTAQASNEEIGCDNAAVCLAPCCEQLGAGTQICSYDWSSAFKTDVQAGAVDDNGTLSPTPATKVGANAGLTMTNPTCNPMRVTIDVDFVVTGSIAAEEGAWARFALTPYFGKNESVIGVPGVPSQSKAYFDMYEERHFGIGDGAEPGDPYASQFSVSYHYSTVHTLTAGQQLNILSHCEITYSNYVHAAASACPCVAAGSATAVMTIAHMVTAVNMLGVSVHAAP